MGSKYKGVDYGAGPRKPSTGGLGGEQAGPLPSRSNDRNVTAMGNLVAVADSATRKDSVVRQGQDVAVDNTAHGSSFKASSSKRTHIAPSKKIYRQYRSALKTFDRISAIPVEERKEAQTAALEWAAKEISLHQEKQQAKPSGDRHPATKRQRSQEESPKDAPAKKRVASVTPSLDVILKDNIVVAVVDKGNSDGAIPGECWRKVESALSSIFLRVLKDNPGPAPRCKDAGWHQGRVKLIACKDQRSVDLYKIAISRIGEVWPGARLEVVDRDKIPSRPRARAWIPVSPSDPKEVMEIIRASNPELNTADWKIGKLETPVGESRQAVVIINQDALRPLEESGGVIGYGFMTITLKVYKSDAPQSTVSTKTVSVIDSAGEGGSSTKPGKMETLMEEEGDEDKLLASESESDMASIMGHLEVRSTSSDIDGTGTDSTLKELSEED